MTGQHKPGSPAAERRPAPRCLTASLQDPISRPAFGTRSPRVLTAPEIKLIHQRVKASARRGPVMAKTKFRPLHDRVVVKRIDAEEKTKGGIIIPDTAKEKPSQGEVVAVGPGGRDEAGK